MKAYLHKTRNPKKTKYIYILFPDLRFGKNNNPCVHYKYEIRSSTSGEQPIRNACSFME